MSRRTFLASGLATLLAPLLLGCGEDDGTGLAEGSSRLSARAGEPSGVADPGESPLGLGGSRDGLLYVPASYDPTTPTPLFIPLHGAGGNAPAWRGFFAAAEERGMILLVPESRGRTWDLMRGGFGPDVDFLDRALAHTFGVCRVDPDRICLAGFSDGASYALSLGVSNGDLFTHLVAFSPGFMAPAEPRVGRPRVFVSHGTGDPVLPVGRTRNELVPELTTDGYDVTYEEFDGGHQVPSPVANAALDWFVG